MYVLRCTTTLNSVSGLCSPHSECTCSHCHALVFLTTHVTPSCDLHHVWGVTVDVYVFMDKTHRDGVWIVLTDHSLTCFCFKTIASQMTTDMLSHATVYTGLNTVDCSAHLLTILLSRDSMKPAVPFTPALALLPPYQILSSFGGGKLRHPKRLVVNKQSLQGSNVHSVHVHVYM